MTDDRVSVGAVIFDFITTTKPPKDKYFVVVGFSDEKIALGTVYINSGLMDICGVFLRMFCSNGHLWRCLF